MSIQGLAQLLIQRLQLQRVLRHLGVVIAFYAFIAIGLVEAGTGF